MDSMRLYVMRHGPAEDYASTGRDADRRLTATGRATVERAGRALRDARRADVTRVLSSPLVRAQQTAELVSAASGSASVVIEVRTELAPGGTSYALVRELVEAGQDAVVIGHQPDVEYLVRSLVRGVTAGADSTHAMPGAFRTAMIIALERVDDDWRIDAVIDPHG